MTPLGAGPPHPVLAGHLRQPDLALSLAIQAELDHPAQQIPALPGDQPFHRIQRHRPARLPGQPGQLHRQRPQPRQHRLRTRRQTVQPVLFHLRLPFRSPGLRNFRTLRNGSLTNTQPRHNRGNSLHKSHTHATSRRRRCRPGSTSRRRTTSTQSRYRRATAGGSALVSPAVSTFRSPRSPRRSTAAAATRRSARQRLHAAGVPSGRCTISAGTPAISADFRAR